MTSCVTLRFDGPYQHSLGLCNADHGGTQANLAGRLSWVRDSSGCAWSSYDERGRTTWAARQIDPSTQVFVTESGYESELGWDDMDRVRSETYPDGTAVHYTYSQRGLLDRVGGTAPGSGWLFYNRTFVDDIAYNVFGQRTGMLVGQAGENQVETSYEYDERRRLEHLTSVLNTGGTSRTLISNEYRFDGVGNLTSILDQRTLEGTEGWSPEPVNYEYAYDTVYRLIRATPAYRSGPRPLDDPGTPEDEERAGEQEWAHDYLGSMRTWTAVEEVSGEHFHGWSLGTIVNGQQLIEEGATTGLSPRCSLVPEAAARTSGPAPHALYFAYEAGAVSGEYEGVEACYDPAGNMVALYRLHLTGCSATPLIEETVDWDCTGETELWDLSLTWDAVGRLVDVVKIGSGEDDAHLRNVYDASNNRVIRLDLVSTEGDDQATLYVSPGYEIRDAALQVDGTYLGGEETKYVFAGAERIARVVERTANGVLPWPNEPGEPYAFFTLTNHLGSASVTVNAEQVPGQDDVIVAQAQLPYGSDDALVENAAFAWRPDYEFTGKEEDPDSWLMYFGARFYAPALGRWVSADPLSVGDLSSDLNQYRYVSSNPIALVDLIGLEQQTQNNADLPPNLSENIDDSGGDGSCALTNPRYDTMYPHSASYDPRTGTVSPPINQCIYDGYGEDGMLVNEWPYDPARDPRLANNQATASGSQADVYPLGADTHMTGADDTSGGSQSPWFAGFLEGIRGGDKTEFVALRSRFSGESLVEFDNGVAAGTMTAVGSEYALEIGGVAVGIVATGGGSAARRASQESPALERGVVNSAGDAVQRTLVNSTDDLLQAAENTLGRNLDDFVQYKRNWYRSPDDRFRVEINLEGHVGTNEGPHVTIREFNGERHGVVAKIFVRGRETWGQR